MVSSMAGKLKTGASKGAAIIGSSVAAVQAALTLAQMGVVVKLITTSASLGWDGIVSNISSSSPQFKRFTLPLLLQATKHPLITLYTRAEIESIEGEKGDFKIKVLQRPRYILEELCTGCGSCQEECSARITSIVKGQKVKHTAIHAPLLEKKAVPSAYVIDKNGLAPCQAACPLGINVQGFVSLLANDKTDKALALINETAPLAGILGRVCTHPCEDSCNRIKVDSPVFIRALHRYAADNAPGGISYKHKLPAKSREEKIAIIGSGPAGLTAAWELTRRGYSPVVFESHSVVGGMLATGIPRFRLPREVREREIEAITKLGVNIRTGIAVGRDVTFVYLKERGYKAFFIAIGTQQNNELNIPGEELDGVVDCMSLLLTLNLKVDTFVGSNIVIVGGGNAAIDSARVALRSGARKVTIAYRRTRAEMPAAPEEVTEATHEGINIEYQVIPVEILGDGSSVTGVRCQKTKLTDEIMENGQHKPEPIPGTDFVIDADHVVVAVGQSPNAPQLDMDGLDMDKRTGVIKVNPLTMQTSIPGVFAGGDCVTGPNNVVDAMAAGLRAAESIDRFIQGNNLETGRSLEPPKTAEVNLETAEISPHKRASMPVIKLQKRLSSMEETTTGLSAQIAQRESQRCFNCALCSRCMECTTTCELGAVFHDDVIKKIDLRAQAVLKFLSSDTTSTANIDNICPGFDIDGIQIISPKGDGDLASQLTQAMAVALETAIEIKPRKVKAKRTPNPAELEISSTPPVTPSKQTTKSKQVGVFLCRCGNSISSAIDFQSVAQKLSGSPRVTYVQEISQACTESGAKQIANQTTRQRLDSIVLAACRCCSWDQMCYSCTDRRSLCLKYLNQYLILPHNTLVEFVNIREQCAWVHKENPADATHKAGQLISAGVSRALAASPFAPTEQSILPRVLVIGRSLANLAAARALATRGYHVELIASQQTKHGQDKKEGIPQQLFEQLKKANVIVKPWPDDLKLSGSPGNYEAELKYGSEIESVATGAVLVDVEGIGKKESSLLKDASVSGLLGRIISRTNISGFFGSPDTNLLHGITIKETAGIFLLPSDGTGVPKDQVLRGLATAARVATYLEQVKVRPRDLVVNIDSKLCRGCGNCAEICSFIEMRTSDNGMISAFIDKALCLGCGTCIPCCPTGAITQPLQSDKQIIATLCSILNPEKIMSEVK
jgi:NADPH-dependent glutamate synthase beta subunit-like oxidoreductase/NAD-dependent dihydropyrimidine dehydrogenase PreA subunit